MTDPAPTLFTRRVLKGEVGELVLSLESRLKETPECRHGKGKQSTMMIDETAGGFFCGCCAAHTVRCPSCTLSLYHDVNNQWACKCGYRTQAREEIQ